MQNSSVFPKSTEDEAHFPLICSLAIPCSTAYRTSGVTSLRNRQRFPETPVSSRYEWAESSTSTQDEPSMATHEELWVLCCTRKEHWVPVTSQEEPQVCCCNSRGTPSFSPQLERNHKLQATTWVNLQVPWCNSSGTPSSLLHLKRNHEFPTLTLDEAKFPSCNSRGTPNSPMQLDEHQAPDAIREYSQDHHCNSRGNVRILLNSRGALFCITKRAPGNKDRGTSCQNWRGSHHPNSRGAPRPLRLKRSHCAANRDEPPEVTRGGPHK